MAHYIDLEELQAELSSTKATFNTWSDSMLKAADTCKKKHLKDMKSAKETIMDLTERYTQVERLAHQVQQRIAQDGSEVEALQHVAAALAEEKHSLAARVGQLQEGLDAEKASLSDRGADVAQREARVATQLSLFEKVLGHYRRMLGLDIIPCGGELRLVFTQIDPADPDRRFWVSLLAKEDSSLSVTQCEPPVAAFAQLPAHFGQQNLEHVVKAVRREFRALVGAS